jgi:hypothetical protein
MEEKTYKCEKCNYGTNVKHAYEKHLETEKHKTGKCKTKSNKLYPEKCEKCGYVPYNNQSYVQHILKLHATIEEKKEKFKFYCEKCNYGTYYEKYYNKHLENKIHIMITSNNAKNNQS